MKNPGQDHAWHVAGAVRRPMCWSRVSEREPAGCAGPRGLWGGLGLLKVGALEGYGQRGVGT